MYTLPGFYIYPSHTSIPLQQIHIFHFSHSVPHNLLISSLRSHTTGEFYGSHTGSILPSQFQKTIVKKLSIRCGLKNYGTCFEHSRLCTISRFVRNHMTTCLKKSLRNHFAKIFFIEKIITLSIFNIFN